MIAYFDTSAVVPLLVEEPASVVAERLWVGSDVVISSRLLYVEARAAVARAHRLDRLSRHQRDRAVTELGQLVEELDIVDVSDRVVRRAGELAEELELRGYDAVHLGSAELVAGEDLVFVSGDGHLLEAAGSLGLNTSSVTS